MRLLVGFSRAGAVRLAGVLVAMVAVAACCVGVSSAAAEGIIGTIGVGSFPWGVSSDGTHVWVANYGGPYGGGNTVSEIEASSGTVIRTITVGNDPIGVSSDGTHVWVTGIDAGDGTVSEIEASSGTIIRTIHVGSGPTGASSPEGVSSDGTHVWVTNTVEDTVSEIEASNGTIIRTIPVGSYPDGVSSDGTHVWVTNFGGNYEGTVSEIEASSGTVIRTIPVGYATSVSSDGTHVWVTTNLGGGAVREIEASSGTVIHTIPVGSVPEGVSSDGTHVWVTNQGENTVIEIPTSYSATEDEEAAATKKREEEAAKKKHEEEALNGTVVCGYPASIPKGYVITEVFYTIDCGAAYEYNVPGEYLGHAAVGRVNAVRISVPSSGLVVCGYPASFPASYVVTEDLDTNNCGPAYEYNVPGESLGHANVGRVNAVRISVPAPGMTVCYPYVPTGYVVTEQLYTKGCLFLDYELFGYNAFRIVPEPKGKVATLATKAAVATPGGAVDTVVTCPRSAKKCTGSVVLQASTAVSARASAHEAKNSKGALLKLAAGSFKIAGGHAATVKLQLSRKARKLLARVHVIHARATLTVHDPATHTTHATVMIRAAKSIPGHKA
jgi:YVTN family beta-propeller protein